MTIEFLGMNKKRLKEYWDVLKKTFSAFVDDKVPKLSAALSYYTVFSLPPMLLISISIFSIFFGQEAIKGEVFSLINGYIGPDAAKQIQDVLKETSLNYDSTWAAVAGIGALLLGATGMFVEIQSSLNFIWGLETKPKKGIIKLFFNRLISFSMILVLGFVLMVSLLLSSLLELFLNRLKTHFNDNVVEVLYYVDYAVIFLTFSVLIAFIFKVLPNAKVKWKYAFKGAMLTSLLFMVGKSLIGYYLNSSSIISAYGGTGSLIVLLSWVYFSAMILYFGAEFTQTYTRHKGHIIRPDKYAVRIEKKPREKPHPDADEAKENEDSK